MVGLVRDRRVITYGRNPQADVRLVDLEIVDGQSHFAVEIRDRIRMTHLRIEGLMLPMPGEHNALNATAAIAVADQLKVPAEAIRKGLAGLLRREAAFYQDRHGRRRHRHRRLRPPSGRDRRGAARRRGSRPSATSSPWCSRTAIRASTICSTISPPAFNDADTVIVAPVYAAGEQPIEGVTHEELVNRIKARGHRDARVIDRPEALAPLLASRVAEGDYVVMLGAGNITQWAARCRPSSAS